MAMELTDATRELLNGIEGIGIYITDTHRRILFWNSAAQKIMGYVSENVIGRRCSDDILCHVDRQGKQLCRTDFCPLYQAMLCGRPQTMEVLVFGKHVDGRRIPVLVSVSPIKNQQGETIGGMEVFRDATPEFTQYEAARILQESFLPRREDLTTHRHLGFKLVPAEMIGGDLLFVTPWSRGRLLGVLIDVSGHGVASALLTSLIWNLLQNLPRDLESPTAVLSELARRFFQTRITSHHFSAQCLLVNRTGSSVLLGSAGHPSPMVMGRDGQVEILEVPGNLIGLFPEPNFTERRIDLRGKRLVCYSDGISEARNRAGEFFQEERIKDVLHTSTGLSCQQVADRIIDTVFSFTMATDPADDLAVLVIDGAGFSAGTGNHRGKQDRQD